MLKKIEVIACDTKGCEETWKKKDDDSILLQCVRCGADCCMRHATGASIGGGAAKKNVAGKVSSEIGLHMTVCLPCASAVAKLLNNREAVIQFIRVGTEFDPNERIPLPNTNPPGPADREATGTKAKEQGQS